MSEALLLGLVVSSFGALLVWTARASVRDGVVPERSPGVRTPTTMDSREAWLAAHRPLAPWFWGAGVAYGVLGGAIVVWVATFDPAFATVQVVSLGALGLFVLSTPAWIAAAHRGVRKLRTPGERA